MKGLFLEHMTWAEAAEALKARPLVLVPIGSSLTQHGLHLPLNTDRLMVEEVVKKIAEDLPVLVLPCIPLAMAPAFAEYPGSAGLDPRTARRVVVELCEGLAAHGARRFYAVNLEKQWLPALEEARVELQRGGVEFDYLDPGEVLVEGDHADEQETSMMLYLAPEAVRIAAAAQESPGAGGNPSRASLKRGHQLVESLVRQVVEFLELYLEPS